MNPSIVQFVRAKLSEPGVSLSAVAEATGISRRSLQMLRAGDTDNAWTSNIEALALHFGYRFEPVQIDAPPTPDEARAA